jgi:thioredoxin reductase
MPAHESHDFDVIVIGGSYAGLSAALLLARTRRRILVVDAGLRRNRFASAAHGFLGQDGRAPGAIADEGRRQLLAYPSVRWVQGTAMQAQREDDGFVVHGDNGQRWRARRLILATGVVDELPAIEGLAERWGRSVFHCPYCHGYELERGRIGVIAVGEISMHQAQMLPEWGTVTLLTNQSFAPDEAQAAELAARGVRVEHERIRRLDGAATVELADGRRLDFDGLFTASRTRPASPLAEQLGCALEAGPMGTLIRTGDLKETSVPDVFACGDTTRAMQSVPFAVSDGAMAGLSAHRSLLFR